MEDVSIKKFKKLKVNEKNASDFLIPNRYIENVLN